MRLRPSPCREMEDIFREDLKSCERVKLEPLAPAKSAEARFRRYLRVSEKNKFKN